MSNVQGPWAKVRPRNGQQDKQPAHKSAEIRLLSLERIHALATSSWSRTTVYPSRKHLQHSCPNEQCQLNQAQWTNPLACRIGDFIELWEGDAIHFKFLRLSAPCACRNPVYDFNIRLGEARPCNSNGMSINELKERTWARQGALVTFSNIDNSLHPEGCLVPFTMPLSPKAHHYSPRVTGVFSSVEAECLGIVFFFSSAFQLSLWLFFSFFVGIYWRHIAITETCYYMPFYFVKVCWDYHDVILWLFSLFKRNGLNHIALSMTHVWLMMV
jgi:hypothetical protein